VRHQFHLHVGEKEITGLPETSPWAEKHGCAARVRQRDIVDTTKGYVTGAAPGRGASWGREARPGTAEVFVYPKCRDKKVVADVLRMDKGHTEGLEPKVTESLVAMMASAPGGKASVARPRHGGRPAPDGDSLAARIQRIEDRRRSNSSWSATTRARSIRRTGRCTPRSSPPTAS
jgi:hypothetical protein